MRSYLDGIKIYCIREFQILFNLKSTHKGAYHDCKSNSYRQDRILDIFGLKCLIKKSIFLWD